MNNFQNKKVLIMGLGLHGGGVAVANWFLKQKARVRITDLKTQQELALSLKKIKGRAQYTLGKHESKDFTWADIVVQNPGVPRESKFIAMARKNGATIENEATIFFDIIGRERIVGVTGTRGKSTTSTLIHAILKSRYSHALFGGNIAISPMFSIIDQAKKSKDPVVLELSSWHLENLGEKKVSPHIAVFTNLFPDHLNRYEDVKDYGRAKENIFRFQTSNDFVVLNKENLYTLTLKDEIRSRVYWFGKSKNKDLDGVYIKNNEIYFCDHGKCASLDTIKLKGDHNLYNILAAIAVAKIFGIKNEKIANILSRFHGLPHRLENIAVKKGVRYVNDSTATTPDGAIAALKTLGSAKKNIILIAGGSDKNIPTEKYMEFVKAMTRYCKAVILFKGHGSEKINKGLPVTRYPLRVTRNMTSMSQAFGIAKSFARKGDIILLSPGCASFGVFKHEFDRGDQFKANVSKV